MPKYFYRGNRIHTDMTDEIVLQTDESGNIVSSIFRNGNSAEITKTQYDGLKDRFVLELDESGSTDSNTERKEEEVS